MVEQCGEIDPCRRKIGRVNGCSMGVEAEVDAGYLASLLLNIH
jgi:hypothetical protein